MSTEDAHTRRDIDTWLHNANADLHAALDTVLDIDAGLADAQLPSRHTTLIDALDDVLDLDAGLRGIVATTEPAAVSPPTPTENEPAAPVPTTIESSSQPPSTASPALLSIRTAVIVLATFVIGIGVSILTFSAAGNVASAVLSGLGAASATVSLLHNLIGSDRHHH
ncbi:hypothetical protein [Amycolatopsis sp. NPDC051102]|uniref:hypothetical protein n=1 Tax=Amycolatopsis sp. NPDC051102 TaxID=3155163 RepID=UPI00342977A0